VGLVAPNGDFSRGQHAARSIRLYAPGELCWRGQKTKQVETERTEIVRISPIECYVIS